MATVLIIGAAGFLGKRLTQHLAQHYSVVAVVKKESDRARVVAEGEYQSHAAVTLHSLETSSYEQLFSTYAFASVINCAVSYSNDLAISAETNLQLPITLLDLCIKNKVPHYLGFDSFYSKALGAYEHLPAYQLCKKQLTEWYTLASSALTISVLQIEQMYGPGDNPQKSIMALLTAMAKNVPMLELTDGTQERDFIYVDDVARAVQMILSRDSCAKGVKKIEVGTGVAYSLKSFLELAKGSAKSTTTLAFGKRPHRVGEIMHSAANTAFLNSLGWKPQVTLQEGLQLLYKSMS